MNKTNKKDNNLKRKSDLRNILILLLVTAVLFFIIGFGISYLINGGIFKRSDAVNADDNTQQSSAADATADKNDTTAGTDVKTGSGTETGTGKGTGEESDAFDKSDTVVHEDSTTEKNDPENDQNLQNVERLNPEELEKLSSTKYSWWIRLNNEHKTPETNDSIKNMLLKHDGIYLGDTAKKEVYLTFDEGYENGYTSQILDVLKDNNVKTIFFLTSSYMDKNPELVKRMLDEGHKVGNHTVNHLSLPDLSYEKLEDEILDTDKLLYDSYGIHFNYIRPPAGEYSERTLEAARQLGYKTVFWSFAYDDWYTDKIRGAEYAFNKVMDNIHNGAVFLLHAVSKDNTEALDSIIKEIKAQGYEIKAFDL